MRKRVLAACLLPLVLLTVAACSTPPDGRGVASVNGSAAASSATPGLTGIERARRHAQCMREHGVPEPDPQVLADGSIQRERYDKDAVDQEALRKATEACRPYEAPGVTGADGAAKLDILRRYARCMRAHGVADFPDPDANGRIQLPGEQTDPDYDQAKAACDAQSRSASASPGATGR